MLSKYSQNVFRILFLGDIVGRPGREAVKKAALSLKEEINADCLLANAENVSGGIGLTPENAKELHNAGVDILTSGNHIWKHKQIYSLLDKADWLLRPANYPPQVPGDGYNIYTIRGTNLAVLNLQGRVFMESIDCPFKRVESILEEIKHRACIVIVDFHAEATSEKKAMLYYLNGKVSSVLGTHTHVQTNDAQITPKGTGYITDLGMSGPSDSILGMDPQAIVQRFLNHLPQKFTLASGEVFLQGVLMDIDPNSGKMLEMSSWERKSN